MAKCGAGRRLSSGAASDAAPFLETPARGRRGQRETACSPRGAVADGADAVPRADAVASRRPRAVLAPVPPGGARHGPAAGGLPAPVAAPPGGAVARARGPVLAAPPARAPPERAARG